MRSHRYQLLMHAHQGLNQTACPYIQEKRQPASCRFRFRLCSTYLEYEISRIDVGLREASDDDAVGAIRYDDVAA